MFTKTFEQICLVGNPGCKSDRSISSPRGLRHAQQLTSVHFSSFGTTMNSM